MKKRNSMLAVAMVALPTLAMSQSSVELYGRLDLSVNYQSFGSTATVPSSSRYFVSSDTSWLGFRGIEDLGQGLSAYFHIEHGFNADTGAQTAPTALGGPFWNRETYVGLKSASLGSVQLGSQFSQGIWLTKAIDPFRRAGEGAIFPMFQQPQGGPLGVPVLISNAVQYISPNLGGLVAKVLIATSEGAVANGVGVGHSESIGLDYAIDRLFVGATYDHARNATGAVTPYLGAMQTTYQAGATYRFDIVKLHGYYYRATVDGVNGAANPPGAKGVMLGVSVPVGSGEVAATVIRKTTDDAANSRGQTVAVQYKHFLSKRTSLYAAGAHQTNSGAASYGIWPARQDIPAPSLGAAAGQSVNGISVGINHFF